MKFNLKLPPEYRRKYCHKCHSYLVPGKNVKVRTNSQTQCVEYTCGGCGSVNRFGYGKEKKKIIVGAITPLYSHRYFKSLDEPIKLIRDAGADAVELSFGPAEALHWVKITPNLIKLTNSFKLVTIHAPCNEKIEYKNDEATRKLLKKLDELARKTGAAHIVFHPHLIKDFSILDGFKHKILLENMQLTSTGPKTVKALQTYFSKGDYGFVLDVAHAYENDPSMELAKDLLTSFGDRIAEFHLSAPATKTENSKSGHGIVSDFSDANKLISIPKLRPDIPIILECGNIKSGVPATLKDELAFVRKSLK